MEAAPLTLAHTHARNALLETRKSNPVAASEEHDLAAGEFATAAQSCSDLEALRTLYLLEQHHKKLAQILRFQHEHPASATIDAVTVAPSTTVSQARQLESGVSRTTPAAPSALQQQPPRLPGQSRTLQRETSSIASNLASARGIPTHPRRSSPASPTLSAQHVGAQISETSAKAQPGDVWLRDAQQAQGPRDRHGRVSAPKQPWSPPSISPTEITSREVVPSEIHESGRPKSKLLPTDEPFQRFYSTFEGLISKLSAPLAFTGLPLVSDTQAQADLTRQKSPAEVKVDRQHATPDRSNLQAELDVNKLFSHAALKAIRDTNGGMPGSTTESFYVVPTTGGTVSYAGILSRAGREARRNSVDDGEDDFVDARETPSSPELFQSFNGTKAKMPRNGDKGSKTMEELQLENQALKHLTDTLAKRVHMWEVNAQSSSMALQQSLKAIHQHSTMSPGASASVVVSQVTGQADTDRRIRELEERVKYGEKEVEKVGRENDKLKNVLSKYRERWEKLKEGAKTRRSAEAAATATAGDNNLSVERSPARDEDVTVSVVTTPKVGLDGEDPSEE